MVEEWGAPAGRPSSSSMFVVFVVKTGAERRAPGWWFGVVDVCAEESIFRRLASGEELRLPRGGLVSAGEPMFCYREKLVRWRKLCLVYHENLVRWRKLREFFYL